MANSVTHIHTDYVEVLLTLKTSQYRGMNYYECTIFGEKRKPTNHMVIFHAKTFKEAAEGFDLNEVDEVRITWKRSYL